MPRFNRLLITGAAGNLGRVLRRGAARDKTAHYRPGRDAGLRRARGSHALRARRLRRGNEGGRGLRRDRAFRRGAGRAAVEEVLESSIKGGYNVYEAARRHG